jgi:hypothetical protein
MNPEFWRRLPMRLWLRSAETWCAILVAASTALAGDLPDSKITPGLADPALTKDVIGAPLARKKAIYKVYGLPRTDWKENSTQKCASGASSLRPPV